MNDLKFALRQLLKNPGFSAVAILTLALGIGANTAIFSLVEAVLFKRPQFTDPDRIVRAWETNPKRNIGYFSVSIPNFADWRDQCKLLTDVTAVAYDSVNLGSVDEPERVRGLAASESFQNLFGLKPMLGRGFLPEEQEPGKDMVVILAHSLWTRLFNSNSNIIGQAIELHGGRRTVIGVAQPGFPNRDTDVIVPLAAVPSQERRNNKYAAVYARLKPGVTIEAAEAELQTIAQNIDQANATHDSGWNARLGTLQDEAVGSQIKLSLKIGLWAVILILAIACANIANLLLVRTTARTQEIAIRGALGAGRWRLARQLLTESLLLSALGAAAGLLLGQWGIEALRNAPVENIPRLDEMQLDRTVLLVSMGLAMLSGVLFSLAPIWQTWRSDLQQSLKDGRSAGGAGRQSNWLRSGLVAGELAVALVLLIGGGLLLKAFQQVMTADLGFRPEGLLTAQVSPPSKRTETYRRILSEVEQLPGVESAALSSGVPLGSGNTSLHVAPAGASRLAPGERIQASWRTVTGGYFQTMGIPLLKGRTFEDGDNEKAPKVILISEKLARTLWGDEDPLGRQVSPGGGDDYSTVIGVVGDVRLGLDQEPGASFYFSGHRTDFIPDMTLVVRTQGEPARLAPPVLRAIRSVDSSLPAFNVWTMDELVRRASASLRAGTVVIFLFGSLAFSLAVVGIYSVMAFAVAQRTQEVGIRMALGAEGRDVLVLLGRQALKITAIGLALGLAGAFAITRFMTGVLFELSPLDPQVFSTVTAILGLVALAACYIPARRAARADPLAALRHE